MRTVAVKRKKPVGAKRKTAKRKTAKRSVKRPVTKRKTAKRAVKRPVAKRKTAKRSVKRPVAKRKTAKRSVKRPVAKRKTAKRSVKRPVVKRKTAKRSVKRPVVKRKTAKRSIKRPVVKRKTAKRSVKRPVVKLKTAKRADGKRLRGAFAGGFPSGYGFQYDPTLVTEESVLAALKRQLKKPTYKQQRAAVRMFELGRKRTDSQERLFAALLAGHLIDEVELMADEEAIPTEMRGEVLTAHFFSP